MEYRLSILGCHGYSSALATRAGGGATTRGTSLSGVDTGPPRGGGRGSLVHST